MPHPSRKRVTLSDVARSAGVGIATVDRVINERGNVSDAVRKRVLRAARELGLKRILPVQHRRLIRVNVILARPDLPLIRRMGNEFRHLGRRLDQSLVVHRTMLRDENPSTIAAALVNPAYDAAIVYAPDHPEIRMAIRKAREMGKPTITVISDLPDTERLAYAGTDHYQAGRSAGYFLSRMSPSGKVVVLCNHLGFQAHAARLQGLKDQLIEDGARQCIARVLEGGDDVSKSEHLIRRAFTEHPDTVAVYNIGAANRGVVAAIQADLLPTRPVFFGHELTAFSHHCLRSGLMALAIDQSPELQAQFALDILAAHFGTDDSGRVVPPYRSTVPIVLFGPQNLPDTPPQD